MFPPIVCCYECGQRMEEVADKLVPYNEIVRWAIRAGGILNVKGWYWCEPCNVWLHQPTLESNPLNV